ncbi:MAG: putative DNA binding domain-containing protein [Slackia sp.]|nr:putative DNA binding domain-containing protein [Slackia sp.]
MGFLDSFDNVSDLHENQHLEFKEASFSLPRDMWETYSAFANTEGGDIVLGVREDKESHRFYLDGVADADGLIAEFWSTVRNPQKVSCDAMLFDGVRSERIEGADFVIVSVPRANRGEKPVRVYDKSEKRLVSFIRRGSGDFKASESDLARMHYDCIPGADRSPLERFGMECLDEKTIARYRSVFSNIKPLSPWNNDSTEDFLYHIGASAKGRDNRLHPTQAGLLAFGHEYEITNHLPRYLLDYREETSVDLRWDDRIVSQSGDWSGNLIDFYLAVTDRIRRYFKAPYSTDETGTRHGSRNVVTEAANEAVVNALVHAYYGEESEVRIILKENALEVTNSGSMLMDREVALAGGVSEMRNPTLMRIFSFIGASDRAGSGLFDIWSTWRDEFGKEPLLEEAYGPSSVKITLPLVHGKASGPGSNAGKARRVVSDGVLVDALSLSPEGMTPKEAHLALGISERTAQEKFKALVDAGVLTRAKEGRSFRYFAKE